MTDTYEQEISFIPTINKKLLRGICKASIADFESMGTVDDAGNVFIDHQSPVLFIAHRDYVCSKVFCSFPTDDLIFSPQLDDRLGIYVALDLLPQYGIFPDILLTTDEEIGQSTAQEFKPTKDYNWMFQFDRRMNDVVTYRYTDRVWLQALVDSGFKVGNGTFSDICYLEHIGVSGVNVGVAYNNEHMINCYASVPMLLDQVDTFATFWSKNKDTKFPFEKLADSRYTESRYPVIYAPRDRYHDLDYSPLERLPESLDCEYCWQEYKNDADIKHILTTGMCWECDLSMNDPKDNNISSNGYDPEKNYNDTCLVCGSSMPEGDFKYGICYPCYEQMIG